MNFLLRQCKFVIVIFFLQLLQILKYPYFQVGQNLGIKKIKMPSNQQQQMKQPHPPSGPQPRTDPPFSPLDMVKKENALNSAKSHRSIVKPESDLDDFMQSLGKSRSKTKVSQKPAPSAGGGAALSKGNKSAGRRRWDFNEKSDLFDDEFGDLDSSIASKKKAVGGGTTTTQTKFPSLGTVGKKASKTSFDWDDDEFLFGYV